MTKKELLEKLTEMDALPVRAFNMIGRAGGLENVSEEYAEEICKKARIKGLPEDKRSPEEKAYIAFKSGAESLARLVHDKATANSGTAFLSEEEESSEKAEYDVLINEKREELYKLYPMARKHASWLGIGLDVSNLDREIIETL